MDKKLSKERARLTEEHGSLYSFACVYDRGPPLRLPDAGCYYSVRIAPSDPEALLQYLIIQPRYVGYYHRDKIEVIRYLTWLLNESPWAPYYLTQDPEDVYLNGAVLPTDGLSAKMLLQAATLLRVPCEHSITCELWNQLVEYMPPEFALMFGHTSWTKKFTLIHPMYKTHSFAHSNDRWQVSAWYYRLVRDLPGEPATTPWVGRTGFEWYHAWENPWMDMNNCSVPLRLLSKGGSKTFATDIDDAYVFPVDKGRMQRFCDEYVNVNLLGDPNGKKADSKGGRQ